MSAQHTPGPWFAADLRTQGADPSKDGCDIGAEDGSNVAIALHQAADREPSETIANARLIAAAPKMLAALKWSEQFNRRPGEGYTECFERIAEVFYRETGCLRPGKSGSPMAGRSMEERQAVWDEWIAAGIARARQAITQAAGSAA